MIKKYGCFISLLILIILAILHSCKTSPTQSEINTSADLGFLSIRDGKHDIILMDMNGSNQLNITKDSVGDILNFRYTNDGNKILFSSSFENFTSSLYFYDIGSKSRTKLSDESSSDYDPDISFDDTKIVFTCFQNDRPNTNLAILDLTTKEITRLINPGEIENVYKPRLSPDATKIVYYASLKDGSHHVYSMNVDGTGLSKLTNLSNWNKYPQFSPDGTKIIFYSQDENHRLDIYSMDLTGGYLTNITYDSLSHVESTFSFSHDGSKLLYSVHKYYSESDSFAYEIKYVNIDGKNDMVIASFSEKVSLGEYSPDGSIIVFQLNGNICTMDLDGTNIEHKSNPAYHDHHPKFRSNL